MRLSLKVGKAEQWGVGSGEWGVGSGEWGVGQGLGGGVGVCVCGGGAGGRCLPLQTGFLMFFFPPPKRRMFGPLPLKEKINY